jgi:putative toxin-antitoxin system antitoxin component (TIGR02293 family)
MISAGVAQVIGRATEVIGGRGEALRWLGTPVHALDYATPVSLLGTGKGRDQVLSVLDQLEHGVL